MRMTMNRLLILFLVLVTLPEVKAQQRLTLEECRRLALEQSEEMKIARFRVEKAGAERAAMKTQYLPSLSGSATGLYLHNNIEQELTLPTQVPDPATGQLRPNVMVHPQTGEVVMGPDGNPVFNMYAWLPLEISLQGAYLAGISLQQPLYTGGKIAAGHAMTRIGAEMAADNLELQRANTLWETDQAYWLFVSVQEKVKLAEAYEGLLSRLEERVQNAWETGMTTRNELLKVTVKHNEARLQLQKARSGLELTRMALCRITGLPFDTALETAGEESLGLQADTDTTSGGGVPGARTHAGESVRDSFSPMAVEVVPEPANHLPGTAVDLSARPEFRLLQKNVALAEEQVKLVRADFLPTAGISVGYNHVGGIEVGPEKFSSSNPSVIASLKIPLFHWGEGRQKQISAQRDRAIREAELEKNSRLMALEVEQARLNLRDARLRLEMAAPAMEQAEENLRVSSDNYEVGLGLLTDLLEAQAQWQNARSEQIEAVADYRLKESAWLKATGALQ